MPPKAETGSQRSAFAVGLGERRGHGDAAGIGVLDDRDRGGPSGSNSATSSGGVGVDDVVVGELLALHLPRGGDARPLLAGEVERRRLVRVLAVAERLTRAVPAKLRHAGKASSVAPANQAEIAAS